MFDLTFGGTFLAGLLSFLSPCILPIVPFYLSYLAGVSMSELSSSGHLPPRVRIGAIVAALFFSAGIITVFVALGAGASVIGQTVRSWFDVLRWIAAGIIFVMGLHFLGVIRIGFLYRQFRAEADVGQASSAFGAYLIGLAFAFGWTPCVGPVLATILFTAAGTDTAAQGAWLLFVYGAGMTLPFVLAAAFVGPFLRFMGRFRRHLGTVEKVMGGVLVLFAVLIATNSINLVAQWMIDTFPVFSRIG